MFEKFLANWKNPIMLITVVYGILNHLVEFVCYAVIFGENKQFQGDQVV
jgi:hypothetical protein